MLSLPSVSSGLSNLHCLSKLSVDGNQLSSLETGLDRLPNLSFVSVENNWISSLRGIHRVRSLLELYIGNNRISTSRDIYYLKASGREKRTVGFGSSHGFSCMQSKLICSSFFSGIDKPHHSGSLWESFSRETGKLSDLCSLPSTLPKSSGWHSSGIYGHCSSIIKRKTQAVLSDIVMYLLFFAGGD